MKVVRVPLLCPASAIINMYRMAAEQRKNLPSEPSGRAGGCRRILLPLYVSGGSVLLTRVLSDTKKYEALRGILNLCVPARFLYGVSHWCRSSVVVCVCLFIAVTIIWIGFDIFGLYRDSIFRGFRFVSEYDSFIFEIFVSNM